MAEQTTEQVSSPTAGAQQERTFTQAEMDAIIGDRLAREKAKYADFETLKEKAAQFDAAQEAAKSDLRKAEEERDRLRAELDRLESERAHADEVAKVAAETGVDAALLARMGGDVAENAAFLAQRSAVMSRYPSLEDKGTPSPKTMTKADILAIKDEGERLRAIEENIDLF